MFWLNQEYERLKPVRRGAVGSSTRAWNFCGVHSVTKFENLCINGTKVRRKVHIS